LERARSFVLEKVLSGAEISEEHRSGDYKTALQELVQRKADQQICYELIGESGPDHNKRFTFRVSINGVSAGEGTGRTKKEAEQMAARRALEALEP
jgi:ribonuclease-3